MADMPIATSEGVRRALSDDVAISAVRHHAFAALLVMPGR
jgi:hypothetical protein